MERHEVLGPSKLWPGFGHLKVVQPFAVAGWPSSHLTNPAVEVSDRCGGQRIDHHPTIDCEVLDDLTALGQIEHLWAIVDVRLLHATIVCGELSGQHQWSRRLVNHSSVGSVGSSWYRAS